MLSFILEQALVMIPLSLHLRSVGKMSVPVAKMMHSEPSFSRTPTHPHANSEQTCHVVSEPQGRAHSLQPAQAQILTLPLTSAIALTSCSVTHSLPHSPPVERGASNTSCYVGSLSYMESAWNSVWHIINAT